MITWGDFILDDVVGPILALPEEIMGASSSSCREERLGSPDARNGASGKQKGVLSTQIQETRQEKQPARMVGSSSHDSAQVDRMSAGSDRANFNSRLQGGEE